MSLGYSFALLKDLDGKKDSQKSLIQKLDLDELFYLDAHHREELEKLEVIDQVEEALWPKLFIGFGFIKKDYVENYVLEKYARFFCQYHEKMGAEWMLRPLYHLTYHSQIHKTPGFTKMLDRLAETRKKQEESKEDRVVSLDQIVQLKVHFNEKYEVVFGVDESKPHYPHYFETLISRAVHDKMLGNSFLSLISDQTFNQCVPLWGAIFYENIPDYQSYFRKLTPENRLLLCISVFNKDQWNFKLSSERIVFLLDNLHVFQLQEAVLKAPAMLARILEGCTFHDAQKFLNSLSPLTFLGRALQSDFFEQLAAVNSYHHKTVMSHYEVWQCINQIELLFLDLRSRAGWLINNFKQYQPFIQYVSTHIRSDNDTRTPSQLKQWNDYLNNLVESLGRVEITATNKMARDKVYDIIFCWQGRIFARSYHLTNRQDDLAHAQDLFSKIRNPDNLDAEDNEFIGSFFSSIKGVVYLTTAYQKTVADSQVAAAAKLKTSLRHLLTTEFKMEIKENDDKQLEFPANFETVRPQLTSSIEKARNLQKHRRHSVALEKMAELAKSINTIEFSYEKTFKKMNELRDILATEKRQPPRFGLLSWVCNDGYDLWALETVRVLDNVMQPTRPKLTISKGVA